MGDGTYLRHGWQPRAERVVERLQGLLLQIDRRLFITEHSFHGIDASSPGFPSEKASPMCPVQTVTSVSGRSEISPVWEQLAGQFLQIPRDSIPRPRIRCEEHESRVTKNALRAVRGSYAAESAWSVRWKPRRTCATRMNSLPWAVLYSRCHSFRQFRWPFPPRGC